MFKLHMRYLFGLSWREMCLPGSLLCLALGFCLVILLVLPAALGSQCKWQLVASQTIKPLAPNDIMSHAQRMYSGQLSGPESIVVYAGHIYTGTIDGWVNDLYNGRVHRLVKFGNATCRGNETLCGRPLGMRMDNEGYLNVVDAYNGLYKVNVTTGAYIPLYLTETPVNGEMPKFLNDLDIDCDGKIYFTESSSRWYPHQVPHILMDEIANSRVLMYDPETGCTEELFGDLYFANGIELTVDKSALLISEFGRARVLKYDLDTKKVSIWSKDLPGLPDNIRFDELTGNYWIGLATSKLIDQFNFAEMLPEISRVAMRDEHAIAIQVTPSGIVIGNMQDRNGTVIDSVSEITSTDDAYYIASFVSPFIGRLFKRDIPVPR